MGYSQNRNSFKYYDAVNNRQLYGNAALLKVVSEAGGADAFVSSIAVTAIRIAAPTIIAETIKQFCKPNMKKP